MVGHSEHDAGGSRPSHSVYVTPLVHSLALGHMEYLEKAVICVSSEGIIDWVEKDSTGALEDVLRHHNLIANDVRVHLVDATKGEFLCPGLIDTHTHAPQFPNIGLGCGLRLLDWLEQLTFPEEKKYGDVEYAGRVYKQVVDRTLAAGTTTCCYYATTHLESSKLLADICRQRGQRAFVGKCSMDQECPHDYVETTQSSIDTTRQFVESFDHISSSSTSKFPPLVQPSITPRFAVSCSSPLLSGLSHLAHSFDPPLAIQTHLSENEAEIKKIKELFPDCPTYTEVYEKHGLLTDGTILAHCVHLDQSEREMIKRTGAGISHCPTSNLHLESGAARVRDMLEMGIKVGLGTDCSGGYSPSLLPVVRATSHVARMLSFPTLFDKPSKPLTSEEIFHLATMGGASLCRLDNVIGNFLPGKEFDALIVRPSVWVSNGQSVKECFERWFWSGQDSDISEVYVRGKLVNNDFAP